MPSTRPGDRRCSTRSAAVQDPDLRRDIVTLGFVKNLASTTAACVHVELTTPACPVKDLLREQARAAVRAAGRDRVEVEMTAPVRAAGTRRHRVRRSRA